MLKLLICNFVDSFWLELFYLHFYGKSGKYKLIFVTQHSFLAI